MKILVVGGGSGGHVTPVVAVIQEIKERHPKSKIRFWCDKKFAPQVKEILRGNDLEVVVQVISAGKFRRYHHLTVLRQIFWPSLVLKNFGDLFLIFGGFIQSIFKLMVWRPNIVFVKGGYVCLPVGFAAKLLGIPIVIHDSDVHPGLTNRILSKWARGIATGAPLEYYNYPANKSRYVGIPISPEFHKFTSKEIIDAKERWSINSTKPLLVVTGGGLGASRINESVVAKIDELVGMCMVVLISGKDQYEEIKSRLPDNDNFRLLSFVSNDMALLLGAADIVVARAGATSILELAALGKTTILIPNAKLTGGHQIKNAKVYEDAQAVLVINEDAMEEDPQILVNSVGELLSNTKRSEHMAKQLASFAKPNAAADVAEMILENIRK